MKLVKIASVQRNLPRPKAIDFTGTTCAVNKYACHDCKCCFVTDDLTEYSKVNKYDLNLV